MIILASILALITICLQTEMFSILHLDDNENIPRQLNDRQAMAEQGPTGVLYSALSLVDIWISKTNFLLQLIDCDVNQTIWPGQLGQSVATLVVEFWLIWYQIGKKCNSRFKV